MRISSKDHIQTVKPEKEQATGLATLKSLKRKEKHGRSCRWILGVGASGLNGLLLCDCSSFPGPESNEFKQPCSMADHWRTAGQCWSVLWYSFRIMTKKHPEVFFGSQVLWDMDTSQGWVAMSSHAGMLSLGTGKESDLLRPKSSRLGAQQRRIAGNSPVGWTYRLPGVGLGRASCP